MQLLDEQSLARLRQLSEEKPQAILLEGVNGHGSLLEAEVLAGMMLESDKDVLRTLSKPEDKTVIGIDQIQALYKDTRAKQAGGYTVWIIREAQLLSEAAQNAFLKLLEEPPTSVVFILAADYADNLLATIKSRCRIIRSSPLQPAVALAWLKSAHHIDAAVSRQLLFLSEDSANELRKLAEDTDYRTEQLAAAAQAKLLVSGDTYEQIVLCSQLAADRKRALAVIELTLRMMMTLASKQAEEPRFIQRLQAFTQAYTSTMHNGNIRAQLVRAVLVSA